MKASPANQTACVLVIDDNEIDREILTRHLGYAWPFELKLQLHYADDGRAALMQIQSTEFQMIFLDWQMPFAGGREVLRALRTNGGTVPVVVVSGLLREEIPLDLEFYRAAFLNKNEMSHASVYAAIAAALRS